MDTFTGSIGEDSIRQDRYGQYTKYAGLEEAEKGQTIDLTHDPVP